MPTTGQDELLQSRQVGVEIVKISLQALDESGRDGCVPGDTELAAEFEQVVLNVGQRLADTPGHDVMGQHHADCAVGFIDRAVCIDAQAVLRDARAVTETGRAVVAGFCVDLAEPFAHRGSVS